MSDHSYMKCFSIIHRFSVIYHIKALKEYGLHGHQMGYILHICENPGISQEELASFMGLNKASITKGLRPLIAEGYVRRTQNRKDRRAYRLFPTDKAQELHGKCDQVVEQFNRILTSGMTEEEKGIFRQLLTKACGNVMIAAGSERRHLGRPGPPLRPGMPCRRIFRRDPRFHSLMVHTFHRNR